MLCTRSEGEQHSNACALAPSLALHTPSPCKPPVTDLACSLLGSGWSGVLRFGLVAFGVSRSAPSAILRPRAGAKPGVVGSSLVSENQAPELQLSPLAALHPVQKDQSCGLAEPVQRTGPEQCAIVL